MAAKLVLIIPLLSLGRSGKIDRRFASVRKILATLLLAGCTSPSYINEVRNVANAFSSLDAASQPLLDDLANAEREQGRQNARDRAGNRENTDSSAIGCTNLLLIPGSVDRDPGLLIGFCPSDSPYYTELTDPPGTAAFRRGLAALGAYTRLLTVLAEGENLPAAHAEIQAIAGHIGAIAAFVGAGGVGNILASAAGALGPMLDQAGQTANWKQLRTLVLQDASKAEALAEALVASAPELFTTLAQSAVAQYNLTFDNPELSTLLRQRVDMYRVAVSQYVVLLRKYLTLLHALNAAMRTEADTASLSYLAQRAGELALMVDAWRRSLSNLRAVPGQQSTNPI